MNDEQRPCPVAGRLIALLFAAVIDDNGITRDKNIVNTSFMSYLNTPWSPKGLKHTS